MAGTNKYSDDDNQCPYSIQILGFGQNPDREISDIIEKFDFSHLYCLAPEQIAEQKSSLYYSDIWACGIIMYIMFSGTHPFKATNNYDLCNQILNEQIQFREKEWRNVSKSAKCLIRAMLNKNPQKRLSLIEIRSNKWFKKYCRPSTKPKYVTA